MRVAGSRWLTGSLVGVVFTGAVSGVVWLLKPHAPVESLGVLYLLAVLPVAVFWGVVPAVIVSMISVFAFGFFFLPPANSFNLGDSGEWVALGVLLVVSVVLSELAARQRRESLAVAQLKTEQTALSRVAKLVARGEPPEVVFEAVTREVALLCDAELARTERYEPDGSVSGVAAWSRTQGRLAVDTRFALDGPSIAASVHETARPARIESFVNAPGRIAQEARALGIRSSVGCPILVGGDLWGVIAASTTSETPFPPGTESVIGEFTELVGSAIANSEHEAELRASRVRIVSAGDETRRRFERDLHDGAQQHLLALALDVRRVENAASPELIELKSELSRLADGINDVLNELLEVARGIHPGILSRGGIEAALKALARRSPVPVELDVRTQARLAEPVEVATYYVVAEMLTNAAKHAHASTVWVEVDEEGELLRIRVRDDGVGGADPASGSGLTGLMDRVHALGGTIIVESPAGAGTVLTVNFPLAEESGRNP